MLKQTIRNAIHKVGWDLHRLSSGANPTYQLLKCLERAKVNLVFDIGANKGQFAQSLLGMGYLGDIVSFEPLSEAHAALSTAAKQEARWLVHPRSAIGDTDGEITINISGNSVSSSVLPMLAAHSDAAVGSAYTGSERTPIARLDTVASAYLTKGRRSFIKIDTQGLEWQVLDGAAETLLKAQGILCELSLVPLYKGQRLWREIIGRLEAQGFTLWALQRGFTDPRDGRSLQLDAIFLRE